MDKYEYLFEGPIGDKGNEGDCTFMGTAEKGMRGDSGPPGPRGRPGRFPITKYLRTNGISTA